MIGIGGAALMNKFKKSLGLAFAPLLLLASLSLSAEEQPTTDQRISLNLNATERTFFYQEMQQMLGSIQGILIGLGEEDREKIIAAAKQSGNIMPYNMLPSVKKKTPIEFKQLGHPTHMMFEEIAVRAADDDMATIAALTGKLMNQCMSCHAKFKAY